MNNEYLQSEREIKGYVEIEYSDIDNNISTGANVTYPTEAPICYEELTTSYDGDQKLRINYASLEEDYFLLDGSFVLPYKPDSVQSFHNKNVGYVSNQIVASLPDEIPITISSISKNMDGLTLYFKDNIPATINATFNGTLEYNITNNVKDVVSIKFDSQQTITSISMTFSDFEYQDRRFRLSYIDFGLSDVLKDDELINFNLIENIGDLNLEFPSDQLTVNLYDEEDKFDINNPSGYANLLNDELSVKIKPHIGILTATEGIKYNDDLAVFYLKSWSNNKNQITLNCVDVLEKIKSTANADRIGEVLLTESLAEGIDASLETSTGFEIDTFKNFKDNQNYLCDWYIDTMNAYEYLQQAMIYLWGYISSNDDNVIINKRENSEIYNNALSLDTTLLEEPKYSVRELIKSVSITQYNSYYVNDPKVWQSANVIYLTNSERASQGNEVVDLGSYHDLHVEASGISEDIGIYKTFNTSEYCPAVTTPATNITFYDLGQIDFSTSKYIKQFNDKGKEIEIDNKFVIDIGSGQHYTLNQICESLCNKINNENKKYDISIKYTGDPSIKPNMIVPIETQYGEKQVKVLRHTLTFNGGLTGTIEGVGD